MAERNGVAGGSQMRIVAIVVGLTVWVLVSICCIGVLVLPTVKVARDSLMNVQGFRPEAAEPVGLANYERLVEDQMFTTALTNVLKLTVARLAAVVAIPLLLAIVVNEFGRWVRIPARLLFTVPMALFAPTLIVLAYQLVYHPRIGLMGGQTLADPEVAWSAMVSVDRLSILGLAWGIGLILFLAALRGSGEGAPSWRKMWLPVVAAWVVGLLATAALAVQSFVTGYAFMGGGPRYSTMTLAIMQFMTGFRMMDFGAASAVAIVILVVTMILGLIVGLIVVFGQLRLEMVPWAKRSGWFSGGEKPVWRRVVAIVLCVVVLLVGVGACSASGFPWLLSVNSSLKSDRELLDSALMLPSSSPSLDAYGRLVDQMPVGRIWINTIVPPLIAVLLQVLVAYIGALAIGAARPFKKWSELLLLPFSPWLLVTAGPLFTSFFEARRAAGLLNTLWALIPPVVLSVPMLFVLTLFFKGQVPQVRAARAEGRSPLGAFFLRLILPSLPLVVLLACFSLLVSGQNLMWQLVVADLEYSPANVAVLRYASVGPALDWPGVMAAIVFFGLPPFLFFFPALGVLQALYLDRLALVAGKPDQAAEEPSLPEPGPAGEAREAEPLEEQDAGKTVRLEEEDAKKTVRLEPEEAKVTKRLEPEEAKVTRRLEMEEDQGKTVRLEPEKGDGEA